MAGTKAGGQKTAQTVKETYGTDYYRHIGHKGGKAKVPKGFALSGKASEAGRKGGKISKRGVKKINAPKDSKVTRELGEKYEEVTSEVHAPRWLRDTASRLGHFVPRRTKTESANNRDRR